MMLSGYVKGFSAVSNKAGAHQLCEVTLGVLVTVFNTPADGSGKAAVGCGLAPASPNFDVDTTRKNQAAFSELPISQVIEFPLLFCRCEGWGDEDKPNPYAEDLFLDLDTASPTFCQPLQGPKGTAMVIPKDLKPFPLPQAQAILNVRVTIRQMCEMWTKQAASSSAREKVKKDIAARYLNPQACREYFRDMKSNEEAEFPKMWEGVECPV